MKVELPVSELVVSMRDVEGGVEEEAPAAAAKDDPAVVAFRRGHKLGLWATATVPPDHPGGRLWVHSVSSPIVGSSKWRTFELRVILKYDYLNTLGIGGLAAEKPQLENLHQSVKVPSYPVSDQFFSTTFDFSLISAIWKPKKVKRDSFF